jgi:hypothetical protein
VRERADGVSEVIGAILLISVVSVAVAIIAVGLLSTPPPVEVPHVNVVAVKNATMVALIHDGGDTLNPDEFFIKLNDGELLDPLKGDFDGHRSGEWPWSIGDQLYITSQPLPNQVDIIYRGQGTEVLMDSIEVLTATPGGGPDVPYPTPTPYPCDRIEDCYIDYFVEQMEKDSIIFSRSRPGPGGGTDFEGDLTFTITEDGSYLLLGDNQNPYDLDIGDEITFRISDNARPSIELFMIGERGWSIAITKVNGNRLDILRNGNIVNQHHEDLTEGWITGSTTPISSWRLTSEGQDDQTRLIINGTIYIDQESSADYLIQDLYPTIPTLWIIKFPQANDREYVLYVGRASGIYEDGVKRYP